LIDRSIAQARALAGGSVARDLANLHPFLSLLPARLPGDALGKGAA
jgi:hypothetical protein